jgi:uncharacterized protein (TIGR02996 family)
MAQEDVLLQRVLAFPDDDGPRLEYAAELAERGNPQGNFIRVEVALARTDKNSDPNYLDLAEASYAMTDQYGSTFAGQIAGMVDRYFFDRGFVELVELPVRRFLDIAPRLYALAPVRHLTLKGSRSDVEQLASSASLQPIRSLALQNWRLRDQDMRVLAASPYLKNLRWLSLEDNELGLAGAEALAASQNLPNLRFVVFTGNPVDPSEQFGTDQGLVVESWMPDEGSELEEKYGPIRWLHAKPRPRTLSDYPPNRFLV